MRIGVKHFHCLDINSKDKIELFSINKYNFVFNNLLTSNYNEKASTNTFSSIYKIYL